MVLETIRTVLCPPFSPPLLHGGFLALYSPSQLISTLHLLLMQIITRVLVPSATFPNFLLVAATNAALFKGPFLINAARMLVGRIQCGGDNFSLNPLIHCISMRAPLYSSFLLGALKRGLPLSASSLSHPKSRVPRT